MKALACCVLGACSALVSLAPVFGEAAAQWVPAGASLYGLTLLPWLALAGLPIAPGGSNSGFRGSALALFPLAAALPALGLAAGLDLAHGRLGSDLESGLIYLISGPLLILLWRLSAVAGAANGAGYRGHALLWWLCLPLSSAAVCALDWAPPRVEPALSAEAGWLGSLNPLMWCLDFSAESARLGSTSAELGRVALLLAAAGLSLGLTLAMGQRNAA